MTIVDKLLYDCLINNTIFGNSGKNYPIKKQFFKPLSISYRDAKIPKLINQNRRKIAKIGNISNNKFVIAIEYFKIMKVIFIFILFNQFFIQIAKKVFIQSKLYLVLIKYYKKRLESQLKNRKTHINEKNLTKSIILLLPTYLFIFFNQISILKPLLLKPPFILFIFFLSLLFLFSQLTQFIFYTSYYNNIICLFLQSYIIQLAFFISNLPLSFSISTLIQDIISKIMAINTPILKNTSISPQF